MDKISRKVVMPEIGYSYRNLMQLIDSELITLKAGAEICGVSQETFRNWISPETSKRHHGMNAKNWKKIMEAVGMSQVMPIDTFVEDVEKLLQDGRNVRAINLIRYYLLGSSSVASLLKSED